MIACITRKGFRLMGARRIVGLPDSRTPVAHADTYLSRGLPKRRYRPELHGVRGLAILGVVLFHLFGAGRVSGGIDIFLSISGYLFTTMLLREAASSGGRVDLLRYFGRLVRRILVPAVIVIVATVLAGVYFLPATRHQQLLLEARASLLYFENVELISSQLAYGAAGPQTSPFQHFWSLSVQGQFYLIWPVVAVLAVVLARRLRVPAVRVMAGLIAVVLVTSFVYAMYVGGFNQDEAYLMTRTRLWELAFGGLLGLLGAHLQFARSIRFVTGWLGFILIVSCGFILDGAQLFPGPWALWPLFGLTMVLASAGPHGGAQDPAGYATRFLSNKTFELVGNYAYGLYLWHWPILIFFMEILNREKVGLRGATFILSVTLMLTIPMYHLIEQPLSKLRGARSSRLSISFAVVFLLIVGGGISAVLWKQDRASQGFSEVDWDWDQHPGALAVKNGLEVTDSLDFVPAAHQLSDFKLVRPESTHWGCQRPMGDKPGTDEIIVCEDPRPPAADRPTISLSGGSHAAQWETAWRVLADKHDWELLIVNKNACLLRHADNWQENMCSSWNLNFMDFLLERDVDLVVSPGTRMLRSKGESVERGAPQRWQDIIDRDTEVLLLRGTPRPSTSVADCLSGNGNPVSCGAIAEQIAQDDPLQELDLPEGITTIDLTPYICPESHQVGGICPAVIGNVVLWYDDSHLTNQFVLTLAPILEEYLQEHVSWLFE